MNEFNRRDFMKLGVGSLAGLTSGQLLSLASQAQPGIVGAAQSTAELNGTFLFDQQLISQVDVQANRVLESVYWGIPVEYETLLPKLASPLSVNLNELEAWVAAKCNDETCVTPETIITPNPDWGIFETAMNVPVAGVPNISDLIGKTMTTIMDGAPLDLSLDFLYNSQLEQGQKIYLPIIQNGVAQQETTITTISPPDLITGANQIAAAPPNITMYGWKLQFRGPETHPLGSCVSQPVTHFNVEVFRQNSKGRWNYIFNAHLGAYRSGGRRCFVLWNNVRPYVVCWKICSPTSNQLKEMFKWILIAAAAIAAVALAAWIISLIASAAAAVTFPALLLLA
jgi:hypothetical protein